MAERLGVGLELLEQPVPAWDLRGMAYVRSRVETLIEADESCYSPQDAYEIARCGAADVLNVKLGKAGGLFNARQDHRHRRGSRTGLRARDRVRAGA